MGVNMRYCEMSLSELIGKSFDCACGKTHRATLKYANISRAAVNTLPGVVGKFGGKRVYLAADANTYAAAGKRAEELLKGAGYEVYAHIFGIPRGFDRPEPTEEMLGNFVMDYDGKCDIILGVGGGVINDICKLFSKASRLPYIYLPTAPSMDGYTSDSSSVIFNGIKSTVYSVCPDALVCDTDIISAAPKKLLLSGIGDMTAKLISICEWRIGHIVTGEYYCEEVAQMMRTFCRLARENAVEAVNGNPDATAKIIEGLALVGIAMAYAGTSRPASGVEHYYSHLWDMRALEAHRQSELHGIQVGVGTVLALKKYEKLPEIKPDREKALAHAAAFDKAEWERSVREYFGSSAEKIIAIENREGKYARENHAVRLERIINNWDEILRIVKEELVPAAEIESLFRQIGHPTTPEQIGEPSGSAEEAFRHTGDIRDKYILSRLLWDLGETERQ